jgi:CubicO group peptidase (beta-lactamase class C family)
MKARLFLVIALLPALILEVGSQANSTRELAGLWQTKTRYGPDVRGPLVIRRINGEWRAEIAGYSAAVKITGDNISFELPEDKGAFQGRFAAGRASITGYWTQAATPDDQSRFASPVVLGKDKWGIWHGEIRPLDRTLTYYLMIKARDDGTTGAFLKNPERNLGWRIRIDRVERDGSALKFFAADTPGAKGRLLAQGIYDPEEKTMSVVLRGGTYDFAHVGDGEASDFYPRGRPAVPYVYAPPTQLDDGWPTASLEDVGLSRDGIEKFIRMLIDTPIDSASAPEIHGVLIARHGKLVLEEYFHGENRDKPHDTRSASKSVTATLFGAAIKADFPVSVSTPVYQAMNGGSFAPGLDPRKKALTAEHLLTMSSGLDCDDADPKSPGAEEYMTDESGATDYYKFMLDLKQIRDPGEKSVYCSGQTNLAGGVLSRAANEPLTKMFWDLLARPLRIKRYYLLLAPNGDPYMGGSAHFLLRDFMKFGQLHLNGGVWNGTRVLTPEWTRRATSPLYMLRSEKKNYGYSWWVAEFPYKGRTIQAFYAGGNGGQVVMGIPELDLVVAFNGGNYSDPVLFTSQRVYVPQYILNAVKD